MTAQSTPTCSEAGTRSRWHPGATCDAAGFEGVGEQDLYEEVLVAAERLHKLWELLGATWTPPQQGWAYKEFKQGISSYLAGLLRGVFSYRLIFAVKPA